MHTVNLEPRLTRRQLLLAGASAVGAAALATAETRLRARGWSTPLDAPPLPQFITRPDLRIPPLTITSATATATPTDALILLAPYDSPGGQAGAVIVDTDGTPVWEQPLAGLVTTDFRVQTYKGRPALTWWQGKIEQGHGVGGYVVADSTYTPLAHINAGGGLRGDLHEFLLTDRNTALLTSYALRTRDLREVGGPADGSIQDSIFQEVDIATGKVLLEWHSLDHIPITESYWPLTHDWDYTHLNSIEVDSDQNLLVSSRNTHTIYKIDRSTGEIIWRLGGKRSDFALSSEAAFAWQHDARRQTDGTITLFDNGSRISRALVLSVSEARRTVALMKAYTHPSRLFASSQGNMQVMPNGNVSVGWGAQPYVTEFAPDGSVRSDARLGAGYISYRAYRMPWAGIGQGSPALVTTRAAGRIQAHVSWNGDTQVARWTALAGTGPSTLVPVASALRTGFETVLPVPSSATHLRVAGSDAVGRRLGTSELVAI